MRMRALALTLAFGLAPLAAPAAGMDCAFGLECVDAEPCARTDYRFRVETSDMAARFVTPAETVEGRLGVTPSGATFAVGIAGSAVHLLTIVDDAGAARYTVHLAGAGLAITYHGQCGAE